MSVTRDNGPSGRRAAGYEGESAACLWLERNGCTVLRRNYTVRGGEIDIIADDGSCILFVEVKLRKSGSLRRPAASVDKTKRERIALAAARYMAQESPGKPSRYDVIELVPSNGGYLIRHIKGAFFGETAGDRKIRESFRERYK